MNNSISMKTILSQPKYLPLLSPPKIGEVVKGKILMIKKREVYLNIDGLFTGMLRGIELEEGSNKYKKFSIGDEISAVVVDFDNEKRCLELSFQQPDIQNVWQKLKKLMEDEQTIIVKVTGANTGGLLCQYGKITGFLPTSQMAPQHFPRVSDGDKSKILNLLKNLVGQSLKVKIIGFIEQEGRLILSEKKVFKPKKSLFKIGDIVEGKISGLVDFGAFMRFNNSEGLIHISEIAWRRLDHPNEVLKIYQKVKAKIIGLSDDKFSLSLKQLIPDPWEDIENKYQIGQEVTGKVFKITNYGLFIELDSEIHGLAHLSELSDKPIKNVKEISKIAKIGDVLKFKIISLEPDDHRLGLSIRALAPSSREVKVQK